MFLSQWMLCSQLYGGIIGVMFNGNQPQYGLLRITSEEDHDLWEAINYEALSRSLHYVQGGELSDYSIREYPQFGKIDILYRNGRYSYISFDRRQVVDIEQVAGFFENIEILNVLKRLTAQCN